MIVLNIYYDCHKEILHFFFSCERNPATKINIKHFDEILSAGTDKQLKS